MSSNLKPWLVLAIIFIAGVVTGWALTFGLSPRFMHQPGAPQMERLWMAQLIRRLNLTADQQAKIQPILTDAESKIQSLHREEVDHGAQIIKSTNDQIAALLTPTQNEELRKMESEREKRFSEHMRLRGFPRDRDGGPSDDMRPHDEPGDGKMPPPPPPPLPHVPATNAPPVNH